MDAIRQVLAERVAQLEQREMHLKFTTRSLVAAVMDVLPDLKHYVSTHGAGPDRRLARLVDVVAKVHEEVS